MNVRALSCWVLVALAALVAVTRLSVTGAASWPLPETLTGAGALIVPTTAPGAGVGSAVDVGGTGVPVGAAVGVGVAVANGSA